MKTKNMITLNGRVSKYNLSIDMLIKSSSWKTWNKRSLNSLHSSRELRAGLCFRI